MILIQRVNIVMISLLEWLAERHQEICSWKLWWARRTWLVFLFGLNINIALTTLAFSKVHGSTFCLDDTVIDILGESKLKTERSHLLVVLWESIVLLVGFKFISIFLILFFKEFVFLLSHFIVLLQSVQ